MTSITFRCPSYSKAELLRAWLNRRGVKSRQELNVVHVSAEDGLDRAAAHQGGSRYGATLVDYDMDAEATS